MLGIIILSKDRACQLDLLFRSIIKYFLIPHSLRILYTSSSEEFEKGYTILKKLYPNYIFIREVNSLKSEILKLIRNTQEDYITLFVDDIVIIREFWGSKYLKYLDNPLLENIIIRAGKSLNRNFNTDSDIIPKPNIGENNQYDWTTAITPYWRHPITACGHIFRKKDIQNNIDSIRLFSNINEMEDFLVCQGTDRSLMICLDEHIMIELCLNRVQESHINTCGNLTASYLNDVFLTGKRMYVDETKLAGDFLRVKDIEIEWI
jgi:hypothetical protein